MVYIVPLKAQSSFGIAGLWGISKESFTSISSFEFNPGNYSVIRDWAFSVSYGGELSKNFTSSLYQISAAKNIDDHFISLRYSPGFQKEFIFRSGEAVIINNEDPITLESRFQYKELFGAGYSFKFNANLSAGFNVRFFEQNFTQENVNTIYSDTIYFVRETETESANFGKADFGLVWKAFDNLAFSLSSLNLLTFKNETANSPNERFKLKNERTALIGVSYNSLEYMNLALMYETSRSFQGSINNFFNIGKNKIGFGITTFHDKRQHPFLAGIIPAAFFTSRLFDVSLSWLKYFSNRTSTGSFSSFSENGISSIINNRYSFDKILLTVNFKLNTKLEQRVKFLDVEILKNIYPSLAERYSSFPIAVARVANISEEKLTVKPTMVISGVNENPIQSPSVSIFPGDTVDINFYMIIPDDYYKANPGISYADFYLSTVSDDYDDKFQMAILINGKNAWDGNVHNLKYFIRKDRDFTIGYSKQLLSNYKTELDTVRSALSFFSKAKFIFDEFIKNMQYISDPRATAEYVQYPKETIDLKGGDCDDLSVCYSALLESVGIETALVDFKSGGDLRHVNVMFNTKLSPRQANHITENDLKYIVRKNEDGVDEVWIPVETTTLTGFKDAWSTAAGKFQQDAINNLGLIKGDVEIIDVY
ncbi:MAG: transglutaminase domain-containing protein [Ignavibacterium sp.]|nr:transglutaminase domain-containing protein [Ignavibacterium sp.]